MKLSEIKSALDKGERLKSLDIEVKTYLPLISKTLMILGYKEDNETQYGIIDECIQVNNEIANVNHFKKDMAIICAIINWYTDIEIDTIDIPDDYTNYDYYINSGLWDYVRIQLGKEYDVLIELINKSIEEELKKYNSIEMILNNNLSKLVNKVPTGIELKQLTRTLVRDVNSMNWDKIPMLKEIFETVKGKKFE